MRWTIWMFAATVIATASTAVGHQPGCTICGGGMPGGVWMQRGLDAEACASPAGYCLVPGCCEDTRHCCDNAWAGYCDHRAKVEAFWSRVGVPGSCVRSRPCRQAPMVLCSPCDEGSSEVVQPTPESAPSPTPTTPPAPPKKAGRKVYLPWLR